MPDNIIDYEKQLKEKETEIEKLKKDIKRAVKPSSILSVLKNQMQREIHDFFVREDKIKSVRSENKKLKEELEKKEKELNTVRLEEILVATSCNIADELVDEMAETDENLLTEDPKIDDSKEAAPIQDTFPQTQEEALEKYFGKNIDLSVLYHKDTCDDGDADNDNENEGDGSRTNDKKDNKTENYDANADENVPVTNGPPVDTPTLTASNSMGTDDGDEYTNSPEEDNAETDIPKNQSGDTNKSSEDDLNASDNNDNVTTADTQPPCANADTGPNASADADDGAQTSAAEAHVSNANADAETNVDDVGKNKAQAGIKQPKKKYRTDNRYEKRHAENPARINTGCNPQSQNSSIKENINNQTEDDIDTGVNPATSEQTENRKTTGKQPYKDRKTGKYVKPNKGRRRDFTNTEPQPSGFSKSTVSSENKENSNKQDRRKKEIENEKKIPESVADTVSDADVSNFDLQPDMMDIEQMDAISVFDEMASDGDDWDDSMI